MKFIKFLKFTPTAGPDADAQVFIAAAGISDSTQKSALDQLVKNLKSNNLWSKMQVIYPMVGGTSTTCKYNLKNPSLYSVTWGGGTFAASGWTNTNTYGDTNFSQTNTAQDDVHISSYCSSTYGGGNVEIGKHDAGGANALLIGRTWLGCNGSYTASYGCGNTTGLRVVTVKSSNSSQYEMYLGSTLTYTLSRGSVGRTNYNLFLGASNRAGSSTFGSAGTFSFFTIGTKLTSSDVSNLYTVIQAFQQTLGRKV